VYFLIDTFNEFWTGPRTVPKHSALFIHPEFIHTFFVTWHDYLQPPPPKKKKKKKFENVEGHMPRKSHLSPWARVHSLISPAIQNTLSSEVKLFLCLRKYPITRTYKEVETYHHTFLTLGRMKQCGHSGIYKCWYGKTERGNFQWGTSVLAVAGVSKLEVSCSNLEAILLQLPIKNAPHRE
jgi:hypothetical protein